MKKSTLYKVMMAVCSAAITIPALYADELEDQIIPKTTEEAEAALVGTTNTVWTWSPTNINGGAVWGNGGYQAGAQTDPSNINGGWWGCGYIDSDCPDTFADQMVHSAVGKTTGQEYSGSCMKFTDNGVLAKFDPDGNNIGVGKWSVDMDPTDFAVGKLKTSAGAILWPWMINSADHYEPTEFEIGYLSDSNLILIFAPQGTGSWGECTWWSFKSEEKETVSAKSLTSNKGIKVSAAAGVLYITADKPQTIAIFDTNGKLVKKVKVREGKNSVKGLNKGLYIVNSTKVKL